MQPVIRVLQTSRWMAAALALLLGALVHSAKAEGFPRDDVFRPLVADPVEPRFFLSVLSLETDRGDTTAGSVGFGANMGLYRWSGERSGEGWQIGIWGAVNSQFDLEEDSYPLINTDFRVGFPLSYRRGDFSARARVFHQSSHLGDEFILQGNAPQRVNLSVEVFDIVVAWERAGWRPYIGGLYVIHREPEDLKRTGFQLGVDYVGTRPVLFGGRLVGGLDYRSLEQTDWRGGLSAKVGLQYGRPAPDRRGITVLLEAYDGAAPFGQFYRDVISYYGLALQFDL